MGYGSTGKLLFIDLTNSSIHIEEFGEELYRLYPGGKALAAYLLLKNTMPNADPLGSDNVLVFATGLLTGAQLSTACRFTVAARSPLSGSYGESEAGGFWGPELKMAGFEAIIVKGKAKSPVYLWVNNGKAEIRDGQHLWGRDPDQVQEIVRQDMGDKLIRVLQIGLGGENKVRYAALSHEMRHHNGRCGMGAVMGSKNLKAIAVRGKGSYLDLANDPLKLAELGKILAKQVKEHPLSWDLQVKGTPGLTEGINAAGMLPTRNFLEGSFDGANQLSWGAYEKDLFKGRGSCYACAVRCKREVSISAGYDVGGKYGGPEYEAVAGFSSNCGVSDLSAMAKANELCNRYVLDTISTSSSIAFAMECFEHGLITPDEVDGLELRFGNADAMLKMIEMIAHRRGFGNLLAEGVDRASKVIGRDSCQFAMQVKGQELPMHDPRGKVGVGLGYAVSETGADHLVAYHDTILANPDSVNYKGAIPLGITEALPTRELSKKKAASYALMESWSSFGKVVGLCYFGPAPRSFVQVDQILLAIRAATGWDVTIQDLLRIGERAIVLARVFNLREGFTRQDDMLPDRLFKPLQGGALSGISISKSDFERTLTDLYAIKGCDPATTVPTHDRLRTLEIGWVADLLKKARPKRYEITSWW